MASSLFVRIAGGKKFILTSREVKIVQQFGQKMTFKNSSENDVRRFLDEYGQQVVLDQPARPPEQRPFLGRFLPQVEASTAAFAVFGAGTT
ncbi:hypothetical protein EB052_01550 [bacterium]|nr:hypothetical protein [bacterium]